MERDLVVRYKTAKETVAGCDDALKAAREEERQAEAAVLEYLEAKQATATGKYEGLGWVQVNTPRLFASTTAETLPQVLSWLRDHGHEAAIKETVHQSTLSQIVSEQLRDSGEVPPGVQYYLKPQLRLYGGSNE
jgi:hypothetical protein